MNAHPHPIPEFIEQLKGLRPGTDNAGLAIDGPRDSDVIDTHKALFDKISQVVVVHLGKTFVHQGEPAVTFFEIMTGHARAVKHSPTGVRRVAGFLGPGDVIGYTPFDTYDFTVDALTDIRLRRAERKQMDVLLASNQMENRLLRNAFGEVSLHRDRLVLLLESTVKAKLAYFLIEMAKKQGSVRVDAVAVHLFMSHVDIADYLKVSKEALSREFKAWRNLGLIAMPTNALVEIPSIAAVERLTMPNE